MFGEGDFRDTRRCEKGGRGGKRQKKKKRERKKRRKTTGTDVTPSFFLFSSSIILCRLSLRLFLNVSFFRAGRCPHV